VLLLKAETHLVGLALARAGVATTLESQAPGGRFVLRQGARILPSFRPFQAVEASLLALAAAVVDLFVEGIRATQGLLIGLAVVAVVAVVGHLLAVLLSGRLQ
jgi:hypothetical protein